MNLKPLTELTKPLCVILGLLCIIDFLSIFTGLAEYYQYSQLGPDVDYWDAFVSAEFISGILAIAYMLLYMISIVVFLVWIYRANKNLRALSGEEMEYTPGWAVGWFFVPFANLIKPFRVMQEIWTIAHRRQEDNDSLINIWWTLWILSNVIGRISFRMSMNAEDIPAYKNAILAFVAVDAISVVLDVVFIMLLLNITRAYTQNYDEQAGPLDTQIPTDPVYSTPVSEYADPEAPLDSHEYGMKEGEHGEEFHHEDILETDEPYDEADMDDEFGTPLDDPNTPSGLDEYDDGFAPPEDHEYR